jgi:hypothetical protein
LLLVEGGIDKLGYETHGARGLEMPWFRQSSDPFLKNPD